MSGCSYQNGEEVMVGDYVRIASPPSPRTATVSMILIAQSTEAEIYSCQEGGVMVDFDDGDCGIFTQGFDEDVEFVCRR